MPVWMGSAKIALVLLVFARHIRFLLAQNSSALCSNLSFDGGFRQFNGRYYACPVIGTCDPNGACQNFGAGLLCAECQGGAAVAQSATRHREGQTCGECTRGWEWPKLIGTYFYYGIVISLSVTIQYWVTSAPLWSPRAIAEKQYRMTNYREQRKKVEIARQQALGQDPDPELLKPEPPYDARYDKPTGCCSCLWTISPVFLVAVARLLYEHHQLTSIAWGYSGVALAFTSGTKWMVENINIDIFHVLDMDCTIVSFFVEEVLIFSIIAVPVHILVYSICVRCFGYLDLCGACITNEQTLFFDEKVLDETFARIDEDADGRLTKEEILEALKPKDHIAQLPGINMLMFGAVTVLNFYQMPLFNKSFLYNLDYADLNGECRLRNELSLPCTGGERDLYISASSIGYTVFNIGSIGFAFICMWRARVQTMNSEDDEGNILIDVESAFAWLMAGYKEWYWWFGCWKMLVKEVLPLAIILNRRQREPMDPGVGDGPGILIIVGLTVYVLHESINPFDHMYNYQLRMLERMTWVSFIAGPIARKLLPNKVDFIFDGSGSKTIGQWTEEAKTFFQISVLLICVVLYWLVHLTGLFFLLREWRGWNKLEQMSLDVAERVFIKIPPTTSKRRQMAKSLANLVEEAVLATARASDDEGVTVLSPAACLEAALLVAMKADASHYGDLQAGQHQVLDIDVESVLDATGSMARDRDARDMMLFRKILDAGSHADQCLITGQTFATNEPSPQANLVDVVFNETANLTGANTIVLNFSIERVELRSLGFKEGAGDKKTRPGVQRALERSIANSTSATVESIDLLVHPVGLDRVLCTVAIVSKTEAEINVREEWLRTALGTKDARNRWALGLEADLNRVGVTAANDDKLTVRFSKGSKPQRTTQDGAQRIATAAVRAAQMGNDRIMMGQDNQFNNTALSFPPPSPVPVGRPSPRFDDLDEPSGNASLPTKRQSPATKAKARPKSSGNSLMQDPANTRRRSSASGAAKKRVRPKARQSPNTVGFTQEFKDSLYDA